MDGTNVTVQGLFDACTTPGRPIEIFLSEQLKSYSPLGLRQLGFKPERDCRRTVRTSKKFDKHWHRIIRNRTRGQ